MPEQPVKTRMHPWKLADHAPPPMAMEQSPRDSPYAELQVTSNFTFLTGASHPEEYVQQAALLDYQAIAITDTHSMAGVVRAHIAAKEVGIRLVIGCRIVFADAADFSLLVYPIDRGAYGRLCQWLTLGKRRAPKGQCHLMRSELIEHQEGLLAIVVPPAKPHNVFLHELRNLRQVFDQDRLSLAAGLSYRQEDQERLEWIAAAGEQAGVPLVATNDVLYHAPSRKELQDVLTCVRHGCTVEQAGLKLGPNAERCLKPRAEMARLFARFPQALVRTVQIAQRAVFSLDELRYQYPSEVVPAGKSAMQHLIELTWAGAAQRYPQGLPGKVRAQIEHELQLIEELGYAHYFLTVHDIAAFARDKAILYQGRGAAANSAVCYCLGVTAVNPEQIDLLFERFVSKERNEPPDIDIDFEHERREEVIQYLYGKYGRDRAALTAEVITYRGRSAVRDVGKALGLSLDTVDRLAKSIEGWSSGSADPKELSRLGLDPASAIVGRLLSLTGELIGFPRHLSQHVGGFVITQDPLSTLVPIENAAMPDRTVIEWDKDDIDAMGMMKVDVLGLGMLTCIRKSFELVEASMREPRGTSGPKLTLASIPPDDPAVYEMISNADTIGVFQVESRAQMSMLPRLRPQCFYDLVIEVAIVRPGPIQGDMVHPYLRRRNGQEEVNYQEDETLRQVLGKTLGVPLFQEQAMTLAIRCAGFTPGEADQLRRAIAAWKRKQKAIDAFEKKLVEGMVCRGYDRKFAHCCFNQIRGFSEYGFPESHAASFALLVYVSAWLKRHHPAAFAAALLNSQPMGFYAPAQIVRDAQKHGVPVRPVDVNHSQWDCTLEESGAALRLGMRQIKGLAEREAHAMAQAVQANGPMRSVEALWRASGVRIASVRKLAAADAMSSMGLDRQQALWQVLRLREESAPLFAGLPCDPATAAPLPAILGQRQVSQDYATTGLSLKEHPMAFLRPWLSRRGVHRAAELRDERLCPHGRWITLAGLCLIRQRPGTASGIVFMTLEDESDTFNLIVRPRVYERFRTAALAGAMLVRGRVERQGQVIHVMTHQITDLSPRLAGLSTASRDFH